MPQRLVLLPHLADETVFHWFQSVDVDALARALGVGGPLQAVEVVWEGVLLDHGVPVGVLLLVELPHLVTHCRRKQMAAFKRRTQHILICCFMASDHSDSERGRKEGNVLFTVLWHRPYDKGPFR